MNTARLNPGIPLLLNGVTKRYGDNTVLNELDLHIPSGQFVAVVGRSGGGKSTLLRLLAGLEKPNAGELPGGQKQRVALARALIHRPRLLLLDEPLGALDALTRLEMQELIVSLWQEHGFTVLLVTHDVSEAVAMADRVLLIEEKKIGLDLSVDIPRPRRTGSAKLAELEAEVLDRVMKRGDSERAPRLFSHG